MNISYENNHVDPISSLSKYLSPGYAMMAADYYIEMMLAAADEYFIFTGQRVVPPNVTRVRIDESISVIPARAFYCHPNIKELDCHIGVKKVEQFAFYMCPSLRRVIMPGVEVVERAAFNICEALTDVQCGKLEIIRGCAFAGCKSLRSIDLPSIKIVDYRAFTSCHVLTNVKVGDKLESIGWAVFYGCRSLERITLPLKDGMICDNLFQGCEKLRHVDLVEGAILQKTTDALLLEEWKKIMYREINSIDQILPTTPAGGTDDVEDEGRKGREVKLWIRSVLHKIVHYKTEHHRYLKEATITLELTLWRKRLSEINVPEGDEEERAKCRVKCGADIVMKNVLPFLELPTYTYKMKD